MPQSRSMADAEAVELERAVVEGDGEAGAKRRDARDPQRARGDAADPQQSVRAGVSQATYREMLMDKESMSDALKNLSW